MLSLTLIIVECDVEVIVCVEQVFLVHDVVQGYGFCKYEYENGIE